MLREAQRLLTEEDDAVLDQSAIEVLLVLITERPGEIDIFDHGANQRLIGTNRNILVAMLRLSRISFQRDTHLLFPGALR